MANKVSDDKKNTARDLYIAGMQQQEIANIIGVSKNTVSRWVVGEGWDMRKAAQQITRPEIVNNLLRAINAEVDSLNQEKDPDKIAGACDKLSKLASTIEKLDKKTNVVTVIDVFVAFAKWLQQRMQTDGELSPELVKAINRFQDLYISELLSTHPK